MTMLMVGERLLVMPRDFPGAEFVPAHACLVFWYGVEEFVTCFCLGATYASVRGPYDLAFHGRGSLLVKTLEEIANLFVTRSLRQLYFNISLRELSRTSLGTALML